MNPTHHLDRSRHYLDFVPGNIAAGEYVRAARALARSASHAVTAAAVHWQHGHHSRRRLNAVLSELIYDRRIPYAHVRTFRDVYRLLEQVVGETPDAARRVLRRLKRRVSRLNAAVASAMAEQPEPLTMEQVMADVAGWPEPEPAPLITTTGELRAALGRSVDTDHANHPWDCHGCRINYHGPIPARTV